jgi:hypothetical protein
VIPDPATRGHIQRLALRVQNQDDPINRGGNLARALGTLTPSEAAFFENMYRPARWVHQEALCANEVMS